METSLKSKTSFSVFGPKQTDVVGGNLLHRPVLLFSAWPFTPVGVQGAMDGQVNEQKVKYLSDTQYGGAKSISPGRTPAKCTIVKVARTAPFRLSPVCGAPVPGGQGVSIREKTPGEPPYTQAPGDGPLCAALLRADRDMPMAQAIPMCAGFPTTPPALVVPAGARPTMEVVEEKRLCDFQAVALISKALFYYEIWSNDNCNIISLQNEVVTIPPLPDMPLTWSSESHLWLGKL